ncbi:MAG: hypothetical protein K0S27_814 [Gammaproteobacteria bacterium]|nr:hypothetical protein [Gammaproteobacteria bacterium]
MQTRAKQLSILGLLPEEINDLSAEEQLRKIRKIYRRKALELHPDKHLNESRELVKQRFEDLLTAYQNLEAEIKLQGQLYLSNIENYFVQENINIPDTAFDLLLEENIEEAYDNLIRHFNSLSGEKKQQFALEHASFLNLYLALEKNREEFLQKRIIFLLERYANETFTECLIREWRELILRLYGEEYLDDFQYREALAGRGLYSILTTRKLLSPVKCMAAVVNSIYLLLSNLAFYIWKNTFQKIFDNLSNEYTEVTASNNPEGWKMLGWGSIWLIRIGVAGMGLWLLWMVFSLSSWVPIFAYSLLPVANVAEIVACPINSILRPLLASASESPLQFWALFCVVSAVTVFVLLGLPLAGLSALSFLHYLGVAFSLYRLYLNLQLAVHLYHTFTPSAGVIFGLFAIATNAVNILGEVLLPSVLPQLAQAAHLSPFSVVMQDLIEQIVICLALYNINAWFNKIRFREVELYKALPLPTSSVPAEIREATFLGTKKATQSHRFFNTPKEAEFLKPEERTCWQKTCSFFGGGAKSKSNMIVSAEQNHSLRLLDLRAAAAAV